jgi:hypothetical protein
VKSALQGGPWYEAASTHCIRVDCPHGGAHSQRSCRSATSRRWAPVQNVGGASPVPVQLWHGRTARLMRRAVVPRFCVRPVFARSAVGRHRALGSVAHGLIDLIVFDLTLQFFGKK